MRKYADLYGSENENKKHVKDQQKKHTKQHKEEFLSGIATVIFLIISD